MVHLKLTILFGVSQGIFLIAIRAVWRDIPEYKNHFRWIRALILFNIVLFILGFANLMMSYPPKSDWEKITLFISGMGAFLLTYTLLAIVLARISKMAEDREKAKVKRPVWSEVPPSG